VVSETPWRSTELVPIGKLVIKLDSVSYIEFSYIQNGKVMMTKQSKFKIEDNKLYLPIDVVDQLTGEKRIEEYKDVYIRKE
jgi:hypothetical protein